MSSLNVQVLYRVHMRRNFLRCCRPGGDQNCRVAWLCPAALCPAASVSLLGKTGRETELQRAGACSPKCMCWDNRFWYLQSQDPLVFFCCCFNQNLQFKVNCFDWEGGIIHILLRDYEREEGKNTSMENSVNASQGLHDNLKTLPYLILRTNLQRGREAPPHPSVWYSLLPT